MNKSFLFQILIIVPLIFTHFYAQGMDEKKKLVTFTKDSDKELLREYRAASNYLERKIPPSGDCLSPFTKSEIHLRNCEKDENSLEFLSIRKADARSDHKFSWCISGKKGFLEHSGNHFFDNDSRSFITFRALAWLLIVDLKNKAMTKEIEALVITNRAKEQAHPNLINWLSKGVFAVSSVFAVGGIFLAAKTDTFKQYSSSSTSTIFSHRAFFSGLIGFIVLVCWRIRNFWRKGDELLQCEELLKQKLLKISVDSGNNGQDLVGILPKVVKTKDQVNKLISQLQTFGVLFGGEQQNEILSKVVQDNKNEKNVAKKVDKKEEFVRVISFKSEGSKSEAESVNKEVQQGLGAMPISQYTVKFEGKTGEERNILDRLTEQGRWKREAEGTLRVITESQSYENWKEKITKTMDLALTDDGSNPDVYRYLSGFNEFVKFVEKKDDNEVKQNLILKLCFAVSEARGGEFKPMCKLFINSFEHGFNWLPNTEYDCDNRLHQDLKAIAENRYRNDQKKLDALKLIIEFAESESRNEHTNFTQSVVNALRGAGTTIDELYQEVQDWKGYSEWVAKENKLKEENSHWDSVGREGLTSLMKESPVGEESSTPDEEIEVDLTVLQRKEKANFAVTAVKNIWASTEFAGDRVKVGGTEKKPDIVAEGVTVETELEKEENQTGEESGCSTYTGTGDDPTVEHIADIMFKIFAEREAFYKANFTLNENEPNPIVPVRFLLGENDDHLLTLVEYSDGYLEEEPKTEEIELEGVRENEEKAGEGNKEKDNEGLLTYDEAVAINIGRRLKS
jgi:hypothetical protein